MNKTIKVLLEVINKENKEFIKKCEAYAVTFLKENKITVFRVELKINKNFFAKHEILFYSIKGDERYPTKITFQLNSSSFLLEVDIDYLSRNNPTKRTHAAMLTLSADIDEMVKEFNNG